MAKSYPASKLLTRANSISGAALDYTSVVVTNSAASTAVLPKVGYAFGCVENNTGDALTITWWGQLSATGTAYALKDQDGVAVTSVIAADDTIQELPSAIAGVPFLVPVGSVASATVAIHLER